MAYSDYHPGVLQQQMWLCESEVTILIMLWIVHCHMWCAQPIVQYGAIVLQYDTSAHLNMLHSDLIYKSHI